MPVYEAPKRSWGWGQYVAIGCGGCFVLGVVLPAVLGAIFSFSAIRSIRVPPKRTAPYHYSSWQESAAVQITLPGGSGTLTYGHMLPQGSGGVGGLRALKLATAGRRTQEWPLPDSESWPVNVGVYWHPAKAGKGPFVRFKVPTDESMLDLGRREVGAVCRTGKSAFMADYAYNNSEFSSAVTTSTTSSGGVTKVSFKSANGKPAADVTGCLAFPNCTYLGSIVQRGKKLSFVPAPVKRP